MGRMRGGCPWAYAAAILAHPMPKYNTIKTKMPMPVKKQILPDFLRPCIIKNADAASAMVHSAGTMT